MLSPRPFDILGGWFSFIAAEIYCRIPINAFSYNRFEATCEGVVPGLFAFTMGMPFMLLQNTMNSSGLVNGMTATAESAILDIDVYVRIFFYCRLS